MNVEVAIKDSFYTLGEGPHWDEATQTLLFVDILEKQIFRWDPKTGDVKKAQFDDFIGFVVPRKQGGFVIGLKNTLSHYDWDSGKITKLQEVDQDKDTRFNDGKCDASGRVWAGTMALETVPGKLDKKQGTLFSLDLKGNIWTHKSNVSISNGLAWTVDNKTMYYIDSLDRNVVAFDFDIATGLQSNERVVVNYGGEETFPNFGFPDGMTIDTEDKLWVANFGASKVIRWDPLTGNQMATIDLPVSNITSCCFGGKDLDEMYITTASYGVNEEQKKKQPLAGSVFKVTGLGVKGRPAYVYEG